MLTFDVQVAFLEPLQSAGARHVSASLTGLDMAHAESLQVIQGGRVSLIDKNVKSYREYRVTMHAETMQRERFLHHLSG